MLRSYAGGANVPTTLPLRQLPYQTKDERPSVGQVGQQNNIDVYPVHNKMDLFGNRLETHGHYLPELPEHQAKLNILNQQFPAIKSEPASGERVSFARNLKGRLFCINPQEQSEKLKKQTEHMKALKRQIEEDARRKAAAKQAEKDYQEKIQRDIKRNNKIEPQRKEEKEEKVNYVIVRSANGHRGQKTSKDQGYQDPQKVSDHQLDTPTIIPRGGYHNQSSLDREDILKSYIQKDVGKQLNYRKNTEITPAIIGAHGHFQAIDSKICPREFAKGKDSQPKYNFDDSTETNQSQRLKAIQQFQQSMLRKLQKFRNEIAQTSNQLQLSRELQKVRTKIRGKRAEFEWMLTNSLKYVGDLKKEEQLYMLPDVKNNHLKSLHSSGKIKHLDPLNTEEIVAIVNGKERRMKEGRWSETKNQVPQKAKEGLTIKKRLNDMKERLQEEFSLEYSIEKKIALNDTIQDPQQTSLLNDTYEISRKQQNKGKEGVIEVNEQRPNESSPSQQQALHQTTDPKIWKQDEQSAAHLGLGEQG